MATMHTDRPQVIVHNEVSVDGRLAISPDVLLMTEQRWPGGDGYRSVMERHHPTVLLEGAGSFVTDDAMPDPLPAPDASLDDLSRDYLPETALTRATSGWLAVTDARGRIRWQYKEFDDPQWAGWHVLVLVAERTDPAYLAYLRREQIPYLVHGRDRVDLAAALAAFARLGVRTVAATGGGRLGGALLRAGLVDQIELDVLPIAVGGRRVPSLFTADDLGALDAPVSLCLIEATPRGNGRVLLRYRVERPRPEPAAGS